MVSDFGELVLALYFSSLMLVFIPTLGLAVGALTGKLTPGVGAPLGSLIGLACGVFGLVLTFVAFWVLAELTDGSPPRPLSLLMAFGLPIGGVFAPVVVLRPVRRWRSWR